MSDTATQPVAEPAEMQRAREHLKYWSKGQPTAAALRVASLLDRWQGLHHMDAEQMKKAVWTHPRYVEIKLSTAFSPGGGLASWDFSDLTTLVFLAHDMCIRVEIRPCNPQMLKLIFFPRETREGSMCARHPTLVQAVAKWRERNPVPADGGRS